MSNVAASAGADPHRGGRSAAAGTDLSAAVARAQQGDQEAFRAVYRDLQPLLLRYLGALVWDDAEDVASETWLQIARDLGSFHGDYDGFRGWAATIARHRAMDHLRRAGRRPAVVCLPEDFDDWVRDPDSADQAMDALATATAIRLIRTLPRDQAEAVLLRAVVGLDAATAGQVLGKRPGAVRTAAYRGLRRLAERLRQAEGTGTGLAEDRAAPHPHSRRGQPRANGVTPQWASALKEVR